MPSTHRLTPQIGLALLLILTVAALARLSYPGTVEFKHDEATLSLLALDWLRGGVFPLTGMPSSVGIPNAPVSVYVMALPYGAGLDALGATLFIALLNVAGVGLLWSIAYRYLGFAPALIAGLVYALSPWAILYSRKIWAQDFHTPLLLLALLLGLLGFWERKRWAQVLCLPVLLLALQIHFAGWVLLPLYGWLLLTGGRRIAPLAVLLSLLLGGLVLAPFAVGIAQTLEREPERIQNVLNRTGGEGLSISPDALVYTVALTTGTGIENEVGAQAFTPTLPRLTEIWIGLIGGAALIGLLAVWWRGWRLGGLVWLWAGLPLLAFTPQWTAVYPHYFIASIPAYALLVGIGVGVPFAAMPRLRLLRVIVIALFCLLPLTQGLYWRELIAYLDTTDTPDGFGPPLADLLAVRDALTGVEDVVVLSDGFERLYDQEAVIWPVLLAGRADCIRTLAGADAKALFPAGDFAVLTAPNAPENPVGGLYDAASQPETYPLRPGEGVYTLRRFAAAPAWTGPVLAQISPLWFDNGVQVSGYFLSAERAYVTWELPGPVDADYQFFVHLLDANGDRVAQQDGRFWPGRNWCAGDRLMTWTDMTVLPEAQTLRVGLYRLVDDGFINANLIDSAGNALSPWADIPLN